MTTNAAHRTRFSIIGPGAVGTALALRLVRAPGMTLVDVVARDAARAEATVARIGAGTPVAGIERFAPDDDQIVFLTVGDDDLGPASVALARRLVDEMTGDGAVYLHASGAAPLDVLAPLRRRGARIAALHPILAISDPARAAEELGDAIVSLQAGADARARLAPLMAALGSRVIDLPADADRGLYHAALVFMSNYVCALADAGLACLEACGVEPEAGAALAAPLAHGALAAALSDGPAAALTGPIARGDADTVTRNLAALGSAKPELAQLYAALGAATVALARRKGAAAPDKLDRIARRLAEARG